MTYRKCEICKEYGYFNEDITGSTHKCSPIFYFKHENWGDEFQEIRAYDFEEAAEAFAKLFNENGDYSLLTGGKEEVIISDGKEEKTFIVTAEQSIDYYAEEKEQSK